MGHSDDRLASAITMGRQKPVSNTSLMHSARQVILITASTRSISAAPRKKITLRVEPAGGPRARFGGVTCNGSLTDHIVRVSLDPDVL